MSENTTRVTIVAQHGYSPKEPDDRLQVRPEEAARLLAFSRRTLRRLTEDGSIPAIGKGKLRRYAIADLRAWQERNRTK